MNAVLTKTRTEKKASIVVDSWNSLIFLVHEPDRYGHLVWNVRLVLGDLPPWRFGPFDKKKDAVSTMHRLTQHFEEAIGDIPSAVAGFTCGWSQEF